MKILKKTDELITHLKNKGCRFNIVDEQSAKDFLTYHNYYMKLAAYRANYDKIEIGINQGKYKNLEFAYLQELSTIDMHIRYLIMHMCADIEHSIRTTLIHDVENNPKDNGYRCVKKFKAKNKKVFKRINKNKDSEYCKSLIIKYYPCFPIWVFVELISFGVLAHLCVFYQQLYGRNILGYDPKLLNSVRDLRNASAHHNCLINKLRRGSNSPLPEITNYISKITDIKRVSRQKKLSNKFLYDFVTLIYVYDKTVTSTKIKEYRKKQLNELTNRMFRHPEYFEKNNIIKSSFDFIKKVVDFSEI